MSQRAHFWLRIVGLIVILTLEFGPRVWIHQVLTTGSNAIPSGRLAAANTR